MKFINTTCVNDAVVLVRLFEERDLAPRCQGSRTPGCSIKSDQFVMYYFTLLFLLCFATPVLITTSLNVYISSAVRGTQFSNISNHQWLTLAACVLMWLPCLGERMLSKMGLLSDRLSVS